MRLLLSTCLVALLASSCATRSTAPTDSTSSKIGAAVTAPLEDLNLVRTKIPCVLIEAQASPYRHPDDPTCDNLATEITALDAALGPDLDALATDEESGMLARGGALVGDSAIGALRGSASGVIPFSGWVRKLTGAERHSKEVAGAIAAGIVRRAYLKGLGEAQGCETPAAPRVPAQDPPTDTTEAD